MNHDNVGLLTTWIGKFRGSHSGGADDSYPIGCGAVTAWPSGPRPFKETMCLILLDREDGGTTVCRNIRNFSSGDTESCPEIRIFQHGLGLSPHKDKIFLFNNSVFRMTL
jgi:hypothetical protein